MLKRLRESSDRDMAAYYRRSLADHPAWMSRFTWFCEELVRQGRMRGGRVLDVGCGFGWEAIFVSLLGECEVMANDIRPRMTAAVKREAQCLVEEGAPVRIEALPGDICAMSRNELPDGSLDAVMSNQTIEHVHDLEGMLERCASALRPGGRMVITNDNNVYHSSRLGEVEDGWRRRDRDWSYIEALKAERPDENEGIEPFAVMRERIVREANPVLGDRQVEQLVAATAGMREPAIRQLAGSYQKRDPLPSPPRWSWCRNPVTGEYVERQLDPWEVAREMERAGLRTQVRHAFRKFPLRLLNGVGFKPLNRALFARRGVFVLVGERRP